MIIVLAACMFATALLATRQAIKRLGLGGRSTLAPIGILDLLIALAMLILGSSVANVTMAVLAVGRGR
jgi:hypothetical protein